MKNNRKYFYMGGAIVLIIFILLLLSSCSKGYKVEFKVEGSTYYQNSIHKGDTLSNVKAPEKEGYTFDGWYIDGEEFSLDTPIEGDIVLEAKFTKNVYKVTIDYNNSNKDTVLDVEHGEKIEEPDIPTRKDYEFRGWYVGDEEYNFDDEVKSDLKIVAKWVKIISNYTVEHYLMGLNGEYPDKPYNTEIFTGTIGKDVTPNVKSYVGFTSPNPETIEVLANDKSIVKYYYTRNKYNLSINGDKGILDANGSGSYYYGSDINVSAIVKDGYTFTKWSNGNKNLAFIYNIGVTNESIEALTTVNIYNINYELNGASLVNEVNNYTVEDEIVLETPIKTGYTFTGWLINGESSAGIIKKGTFGDLNLEATFKPNEDTKYKVQYYLMDGKGKNYILDKTITKTGISDTKIEFTPGKILGFANPVLKDKYNQKVKIDDLVIEPDGSTILKYYYERNQYTLNLNFDKGIKEVKGNGKYYYETDVQVSAKVKDGYTFDKWSNGNDNISFTYKVGAKNDTLTASTTLNTYDITYDLDGGSLANKVLSYTVESEDFNLGIPDKVGYTFTGWIVNDKASDGTIVKGTLGALHAKATYTPNTNTKYVVEHYLMNLDGNSYTLWESETLAGTTDTDVTPKTNTYDGFTSPATQTVNVNGDGSTVVRYEYTRNQYDLNIVGDKGIKNTTGTGTYYYGTEVEVGYELMPGYSFDNYSEKVTDGHFVIPAENVTLNVNSKANDNTKYVVEHYLMNLDGSSYTLWKSETLTGTTDTDVTPKTNTYDGFTSPATQTVNINGDGSTVVRYEYTRNQYDLNISYINKLDETDRNGVKKISVSGSHYYGETVNISIELDKGYELVEWSNGEKSNQFDYVMTFSDDQSLVATIQKSTYTVTFDSKNGSPVESARVLFGNLVTKPVDPTRPGYNFDKWYKESSTTNSWNFETEKMPAENITLYAGWNIHKNTVTFKANGGHFASGSIELDVPNQDQGAPIRITPETPTRDGYEFAGWYKVAKAEKDDKAWDFETDVMPDDSLILYANWKAVNYQVKYDVAEYANDNPSTYNIENEYLLKAPTKTGYIFEDWTITFDDSGTTQKVVDKIPKGLFGNITLTANFRPVVYKLEYHDNNGDKEKPVLEDVKYGEIIELISDNTFNKQYTITYDYGYDKIKNTESVKASFICWSTKEKDGTCLVADDNLKNLASDPDREGEVVKLYAQWGPSETTLLQPERPGYNFINWNKDGTPFSQKFSLDEDVTLTANWAPNEIMINYYENWLKSNLKYESVNYEEYSLKASNTYSKNYRITYNYNDDDTHNSSQDVPATFECWMTIDGECFSEENLYNKLVNNNNIIVELYPKWISSSTVLERPSRVGYQLAGWKEDGVEAGYADYNYSLDRDVTLIADWTPNRYTVTLHPNGGEGEEYIQYFEYDSSQTLHNNFTRTGYNHIGWSRNPDPNNQTPDPLLSGPVENLTTDNNVNIDIYAVWDAKEYFVRYHENNGGTIDNYKEYTYKYDQEFTLMTADELGFKKTYKVTYDTNYPSDLMPYDIKENLSARLIDNTFDGWYNSDKSKTYKTSEKITNITAPETTIDLYVNWVDPSFEPQILNDVTDYRFKGYNSNIESIGFISKGSTVTITGDITLMAKWNLIPYITDFGFDIFKDKSENPYDLKGVNGEKIDLMVKGDHASYLQLPLDSIIKPAYLSFAFNTNVTLQTIKSSNENNADINYSKGLLKDTISLEGNGIDVRTSDNKSWKGYDSATLKYAQLEHVNPDTLFEQFGKVASLPTNYEFYIPAGFAKTSDGEPSDSYITHRVKKNGSWWLFFAKEGTPTVNVKFVNASYGNEAVLEFKNVVYKGSKTPNVGKVADGQREFVGWFKNQEMTIPYNFDEILTNDVIVYGKYEEPKVDETWYDESKDSFDISNLQELRGFASLIDKGKTFANKTVNLVSDIDMSGIEWTAVNGFKGHFNGHYHTLSNLNVTNGFEEQGELRLGMFAILSGANTSVENLKFTTANISNSTATGIGVVAGKLSSGAKISEISIDNSTITGKWKVGGAVGVIDTGTINEVQVSNSKITTTTNGNGDTGGIVGIASGTNTLKNLIVLNTNISSVSDKYIDTGGILGDQVSGTLNMNNVIFAGGSIKTEFSGLLGRLTGSSPGGISSRLEQHKNLGQGAETQTNLAGSNDATGFYDSNVIKTGVDEKKKNNKDGIGHSEEMLKSESIYNPELWDLDEVWSITNGSYPVLKCTLKAPTKNGKG